MNTRQKTLYNTKSFMIDDVTEANLNVLLARQFTKSHRTNISEIIRALINKEVAGLAQKQH